MVVLPAAHLVELFSCQVQSALSRLATPLECSFEAEWHLYHACQVLPCATSGCQGLALADPEWWHGLMARFDGAQHADLSLSRQSRQVGIDFLGGLTIVTS